MGTTIMTVYHGTDQSVAQDILRQGFRCKENKEHWLGELPQFVRTVQKYACVGNI